MTPATIARLAALAPPPPDPARCAACGARSGKQTASAGASGVLVVCQPPQGCGAAWWAQDGTRDVVCGPGGVPPVAVPLVRPAKVARAYPFVCCACRRDVSRVYSTGHCCTCHRAAIRAGELIPQGRAKPAKRAGAVGSWT